MSIQERVGMALRRAREHAGLTQRQVAADIGIAGPSLSLIESGSSGASLERLNAIAEACGAELHVEVAHHGDEDMERVAALRELIEFAEDSDRRILDAVLDSMRARRSAAAPRK